MTRSERHIILFDGVCNLCNASVRFVYQRDKAQKFQYQSLQSDKGKQLLQEMDYDGEDLSSFVYIKNKELFTKSTAALQVAKTLGFPYSFAQVFLILPTFIRDGMYGFIAVNRYRWFGKRKEVCEFDPNFQNKVL